MEEKVLMAALAGLLCDVGKFAQRAGELPNSNLNKDATGSQGIHTLLSQQFVSDHVPPHLEKALGGMLSHHQRDSLKQDNESTQTKPTTSAPGGSKTGGNTQTDPKDARLTPILSSISLMSDAPDGWTNEIVSLDVFSKSIYPTKDKRGDYAVLWKEMIREIDGWKKKEKNWDTQSGEDYFITLSAVLHKYLWCIPSETPLQTGDEEKLSHAGSDVSLYDHCRLNSAISACLTYDGKSPDEKGIQSIALLARGDFSGIQNFIYRISRTDSDTEHIAKRLRGRSFYVQLLTEVVVDWILREIGLPNVCAIFIGGGRFDLLLPLSAQEKLSELQHKLEDWLLQKFQGEIGVLIAAEPTCPADFSDARGISRRLDANLDKLKHQKWKSHLTQENFYTPVGEKWHVCKVCQLTPMDETGICPQCAQHADIGKHLPHARYLAFCYNGKPNWDAEQVVEFPDSPFGVQVAIVRNDDNFENLLTSKCRMVVSSVNRTKDFIHAGVASSFRFLANSAPKAQMKIAFSDEQSIGKGDILHFEALAALSKGAKRLGVLKADVDRLGLVMSEGLSEAGPPKHRGRVLHPTLARIASLSRTLDVFFAGVLNRICQEVFEEWKQDSGHEYVDKTDGLFYVMYSGGDDLFVIGPWDQILVLALKIQQEFQAFTGENSNITLSAGYVQVKPRYPVQKFADLVDEAEAMAKKQRNQFFAFGEAMFWTDKDIETSSLKSSDKEKELSFKWLFEQAQNWTNAIKNNDLSSGLIYDLGSLFRQHQGDDGKLRPMWTPRLYYTLARRLNTETRQIFQQDIFKVITSGKTLIPVSIASLSIRERSE